MSDDNINHASRVGSADHVDTAEHVDTVNTLSISTVAAHPPEKTKDQKTVVLFQYIVAFFVVCAVLASVLTAGYVLVSRNKGLDTVNATLNDTKTQLSVVQTQLDAAKKQLDAFNTQSDGTRECSDQLSRNITAANQADISGLIKVLVVLGSPDDDPVHPRSVRYSDALVRSLAADDAYGAAVAQRDKWVASGSPIPCPVVVSS